MASIESNSSGEKVMDIDSIDREKAHRSNPTGEKEIDIDLIDRERAHSRIRFAGENNEYVIINGQQIRRHVLVWSNPKYEYGNGAAVGLASFALSAVVLGLYLAQAKDIKIPNAIVSLAFSYAGIVEFLAGAWELVNGDTFTGTVFTSFAGFWLSFASIYIPSFGILDAYADEPEQLGNAIGFYLIGWGIFSIMLTFVVMKATWPLLAVFVCLDLTFFLVGFANINGSTNLQIAGGVTVTIAGVLAWYIMYFFMCNKGNTYLIAPTLALPVFHSK
ncbi:uncharacterized protein J8A68_002579 [[Candida] subhashii]|uniref:Ammonia transport outward protein 2 n=1 Tax=[Candida] subhashii TaxID=561895 RepID=A0A8J5QG53_9ASCO|nr:uncharacterized protein J8A68_002579 [[Candida] subhashii]KAG7663891.1 hypothetical protein J8A68_002579 [[Candida] subhashii]